MAFLVLLPGLRILGRLCCCRRVAPSVLVFREAAVTVIFLLALVFLELDFFLAAAATVPLRVLLRLVEVDLGAAAAVVVEVESALRGRPGLRLGRSLSRSKLFRGA